MRKIENDEPGGARIEELFSELGQMRDEEEKFGMRKQQVDMFRRLTKGVSSFGGDGRGYNLVDIELTRGRISDDICQGLPIDSWRAKVLDVEDDSRSSAWQSDALRWMAVGIVGLLPMSGYAKFRAIERINYDGKFNPEIERIKLLIMMGVIGLSIGIAILLPHLFDNAGELQIQP